MLEHAGSLALVLDTEGVAVLSRPRSRCWPPSRRPRSIGRASTAWEEARESVRWSCSIA